METAKTPTKTEYILDSIIYLTYKTKMIHLFVLVYEKLRRFVNVV